jgi:hypothetical protein
VLVSVPAARLPVVQARGGAAGIPVQVMGVAGGDRVVIEGLVDVSVADATEAWTGALPAAISSAAPPG